MKDKHTVQHCCCLPCKPQSWPVYSPAPRTERAGTPSEPPLSGPETPEPGPYVHDPAGTNRQATDLLSTSELFTFSPNKAGCRVSYLGPERHQSAGHLSISQSFVVVLQTGVDLGAVTEQNVVQGSWGGRKERRRSLTLMTKVRNI